MTGQDPGDQQMSSEEAARVVQREPALHTEPDSDADENLGVDDDATTPDQAVSNQE